MAVMGLCEAVRDWDRRCDVMWPSQHGQTRYYSRINFRSLSNLSQSLSATNFYVKSQIQGLVVVPEGLAKVPTGSAQRGQYPLFRLA
jgi:hypothetical protein